MNKEQIKYLLDNINCEVKSNINWIEPLGLDRDTWKSLLEYIQQKDKEIERLNNIIDELERRFNQELENNEKWNIEDTKQFYSKKWYKDTLNDFKNMIKN